MSTPDDETIIWRYMDVSKFVSLMFDESLFFASPKVLADKHEGACGWGYNIGLIAADIGFPYSDTGNGRPPIFDGDEDRGSQSQLLQDPRYQTLTAFKDIQATNVGISCWHRNSGESSAMWEIYAYQGRGIAIVSTVGRLKLALADANFPLHIGEVQYTDTCDDLHIQSQFDTLMYKRAPFEWEREIRAVGCPGETCRVGKTAGWTIQVSLADLVERIVLAPRIALTVERAVASVLERSRFPDLSLSTSSM